jgi:integrase
LTAEELILWKQKILPNLVSKKTGIKLHHNTQQQIVRMCRRFLRFTHTRDIKYDPHEPYPRVLKCLTYEQPTTDAQQIRRNLPTVEEAKAILEHCGSIEYQALFSIMIEVGPRSGDILSMSVGDVEFDQYGATVFINKDTKTGQRAIPIYYSAPILRQWIEQHIYKNDPNAPLWISRNTNKGKPKALGRGQVRNVLVKAVRRANINKRIYPHLLRHFAVANLAKKKANEVLLNRIFGWTDKGKTASIYLNGFGDEHTREAYLELHGARTEKQRREEEALKPKECLRCKTVNPATHKFCGNCSFPLTSDVAFKLHQSEEKANRVQELIIRHIREKDPKLFREAVQQPEAQRLLSEIGIGGE